MTILGCPNERCRIRVETVLPLGQVLGDPDRMVRSRPLNAKATVPVVSPALLYFVHRLELPPYHNPINMPIIMIIKYCHCLSYHLTFTQSHKARSLIGQHLTLGRTYFNPRTTLYPSLPPSTIQLNSATSRVPITNLGHPARHQRNQLF